MLRTSRKDTRKMQRVVLALGYEPVSSRGGHLVYRQDGQPDLSMPNTPSDRYWEQSFLNQLRKRHPGHDALKRSRGKHRAAKGRARPPKRLHLALPTVAVDDGQPANPATPSLNGRPQCVGCGRPWLSDLPFAGRDCPACGAAVAA